MVARGGKMRDNNELFPELRRVQLRLTCSSALRPTRLSRCFCFRSWKAEKEGTRDKA